MIKKSDEYCEEHDAYFDRKKDVWVEDKCGDPKCNDCSTRPDKPSQMNLGKKNG